MVAPNFLNHANRESIDQMNKMLQAVESESDEDYETTTVVNGEKVPLRIYEDSQISHSEHASDDDFEYYEEIGELEPDPIFQQEGGEVQKEEEDFYAGNEKASELKHEN
jgi:hypothetical protein